jgi:hypothetical protein
MIQNRNKGSFKNGNVNVTDMNVLIDEINAKFNSLPTPPVQPKPYIKILLSQLGEDAPTMTVIDEVGDTGLSGMTFFYSAVGQYYTNEEFDLANDDVHITMSNLSASGIPNLLNCYYNGGYFYFNSWDLGGTDADSLFLNTAITITVDRKANIVVP